MLFLLQHGHCTFVTILLRPFARLFFNLAMLIRALFPKSASPFPTCRTSILEDAIFPCEVILAKQSRHSSTGTLASGTSGSRRISLVRFCTLIDIVTETAIVSLRTPPVGFPLPTISQTSLFTLFCPLILDHGACFIISISGFEVLHSQTALDTSFNHRLQSVIIRSSFLLTNLHIVQFQYGLEFLRLSYS